MRTARIRHRVAMVLASPFPAPRGTQAWIGELMAALTELGHEVHLFCYGQGMGGNLPDGVELHRAPRLPGVPADLDSAPSLARPINDFALLTTMLRDLPRLAPTVIHGHNHEGGIAAGIAGRLLGIPVVHQIHGALAEELVAWAKESSTGRTDFSRAAGAAGWAIDHGVPRMAHRVLTLDSDSPATAGYSVSEVTVLPPGVTLFEQQPRDRSASLPLDELWAVYPGNLDPYQSLPLLREAWPLVRAALPEAKLAFVTHDVIHHSAGSLQGAFVMKPDSVMEASSLVATGRLVVIPRTGGGGYPLKMLNALGSGVPVVACRAAAKGLGPAEGVLPVEPSPWALAEGIVSVLRNRRLRSDLSRDARSFAEAHPWSKVAEAVAEVYDSVGAGVGGGPHDG